MGATPQTQAINGANDLLLVMQQLQSVRAAADNWLRQYNAANWSAAWNAMGTAVANPDGSLGAADGTPNNARPIDTRLAGAANLAAPLSANDLTNAAAIITSLDNFFTNVAVTTSNRDAVMNKFRAG